jgi:subtilisin family serine protease
MNERLNRIHCAWSPDDPYYNNDNNPVGFPGQWHLGNGASPTHANVVAAWNRDITGSGVKIGIVDDSLETTHPDLSPNYVAADSWDFGQNDGVPDPVYPSGSVSSPDRHGISVAGVAAARGGNGIGVTGAAPLAGLAGLRIDFPLQTTDMFVDATEYHSSGGNTNIKIKNHSYGYSAPYIESQAERDAAQVSATAGTIHLFAAGNERGEVGEDSNKQDVQSSPDVIAVAALGSDGVYSWYSSFGANVFVTAPSNGVSGFGITTTDRTGSNGYNPSQDTFPNTDYTSVFGGTSSATPLAAGIMALAKQVQPALNVRFAKHLLARTSTQCDPSDGTETGGGTGSAGTAWKTNAAGFKFNQNYGFGLVNADLLCAQAVLYSGVTPLQMESVATTNVNSTISSGGVTRNFSMASSTPLEEVLVTLSISHGRRGDVEAYLTSPSNTVCRLMYRSLTNESLP